jgi:hypothetical protein
MKKILNVFFILVMMLIVCCSLNCSAGSFKEEYIQSPASATAEFSATSEGRHTFRYQTSIPVKPESVSIIVLDGKKFEVKRGHNGKLYVVKEVK